MYVCGIDAEILRPAIAKTEGEPIPIRVRQARRPKLIADWGGIEGQSAAKCPVGVGPPGRPDTAEPGAVPLLGLVTQRRAVGPLDPKSFYDAPVGPLNFCQ